jgi:hypothetical protein
VNSGESLNITCNGTLTASPYVVSDTPLVLQSTPLVTTRVTGMINDVVNVTSEMHARGSHIFHPHCRRQKGCDMFSGSKSLTLWYCFHVTYMEIISNIFHFFRVAIKEKAFQHSWCAMLSEPCGNIHRIGWYKISFSHRIHYEILK